MIPVPERIGIIGGSGIYDINKGVKLWHHASGLTLCQDLPP
jgi:purine nucleoside phosphorylase